MNAFSRQGKTLPSEVRNQIVEKWSKERGYSKYIATIKPTVVTVSMIVDLRAVIRRPYLHHTSVF